MISKQWKKEQVWQFYVVLQLIHRLTQADISCTTTASLFFFPLLDDMTIFWLSNFNIKHLYFLSCPYLFNPRLFFYNFRSKVNGNEFDSQQRRVVEERRWRRVRRGEREAPAHSLLQVPHQLILEKKSVDSPVCLA